MESLTCSRSALLQDLTAIVPLKNYVKSKTNWLVPYLQYGPAVCPVRTEPEVPAMRSVAPPPVVLALGGVLS